MGFFSSRRPDNDYIADPNTDNKSTVVQVIRSRFYGKHKGKDREEPPVSFISQDVSTAQTLSSFPKPSAASHASIRKSQSAPLYSSKTAHVGSSSSNTPRTLNDRYKAGGSSHSLRNKAPPSPLSKTHNAQTLSTPKSDPNTASGKPTPTAATRKPTDSVTMTLAQRLNELAVANSEGLLDDDEYRLLRQNLFERFASTAIVPTENPVVPATPERHSERGATTVLEGRPSISSRLSSNFNVDLPRSPSVRSKTSVRSGVTSLLQRATGRRSKDFSDTSSIFSATSISSKILRKNPSSASLHTDISRAADTISISSRRAGSISERSPTDSSLYSPQTPLRATSIRKMATPPSSFATRGFVNESKFSGSVKNIFEETILKTSQDIKQEIAAVEAEGRRLMDAFNGLEVTTLAKRQRHQNSRPNLRDNESGGIARQSSAWTLIPESNNQHLRINDSDVMSIRSGTSVGTAPSIHRSVYGKTLPSKGSNVVISGNVSRSGSLRRKNSSSSVSSSTHAAAKSRIIPPVPALPANLGQAVGHASNSSINLTRSTGHLPMSSVPEDEARSMSSDGDLEVDTELDEIRRRREEVSKRYKARVDYLRAKLKGAELHEKLMKK